MYRYYSNSLLLVSRPQNFASRDRCFSDGSRDASEEILKYSNLVQAKVDKTQCTNHKST